MQIFVKSERTVPFPSRRTRTLEKKKKRKFRKEVRKHYRVRGTLCKIRSFCRDYFLLCAFNRVRQCHLDFVVWCTWGFSGEVIFFSSVAYTSFGAYRGLSHTIPDFVVLCNYVIEDLLWRFLRNLIISLYLIRFMSSFRHVFSSDCISN